MALLRARVALRLATAAAGLLNHRGLPVAPDPGRDAPCRPARSSSGATLGAVRERLKTAASGPLLVPAGLLGAEEQLFDLHPPAGRASGYAPVAKAVAEWQAISAVASDPAAIAAVAWSAARSRLEGGSVCAVPLNGVAPTEATLRDGTYPATVPVSFAWERKPRFGRTNFPGFQRRWYFEFLRSAAVREILLTGRGRERLLP